MGAIKHGMFGTPEYTAWSQMIQRCKNPKMENFKRYGDRGITVCQRWRDSFEAFYADMGARPAGLTLDRINNDGNYEPGNCRWATHAENTNNRRVTIRVEFRGETHPLGEWAKKLNMDYDRLFCRIYSMGWSIEDAFTRPLQIKDALISFNGKSLTLTEWAAETGIKYATIRKRLLVHKMPPEKALTMPKKSHFNA